MHRNDSSVTWQTDPETGEEFVSIPDVAGPGWWAQLHSWAENIRDHGCSNCGEFAVSMTVAMHDLVNAKLIGEGRTNKRIHDPENMRRFAHYFGDAVQQAAAPAGGATAMGQREGVLAQRIRRCLLDPTTFRGIGGEIRQWLRDMQRHFREDDPGAFIKDLESLCNTRQTRFARVAQKTRVDPWGSRCRDRKTGSWLPSGACGDIPIEGTDTFAIGANGLTRYEFQFRVVDLSVLVPSNDPFTFVANPEFPAELQPRMRDRAATRLQVERIAANLDPDALLTDFRTLDRGAPIVGPDMVVESGNGRIMGLLKASVEFPDVYSNYVERLATRASEFGLSDAEIESVQRPVLVRERTSDVDRTAFVEEANAAAALAPSAVEQAQRDSSRVTLQMISSLVVGDNQAIEDALRSPSNQVFVTAFLGTLPENEQARLVDATGRLNQDAVRRMTMALFVSAFPGGPGIMLSHVAFESVDLEIRNVINGIGKSLGRLAAMEAQIRAGERQEDLSIGADLAVAVTVFVSIVRTPGLNVASYLNQGQLFERELTPFQEDILITLDARRRSAKRIGKVLGEYAGRVLQSAPPAQGSFLPDDPITKEGLWEAAVKVESEEHLVPTLLQHTTLDGTVPRETPESETLLDDDLIDRIEVILNEMPGEDEELDSMDDEYTSDLRLLVHQELQAPSLVEIV